MCRNWLNVILSAYIRHIFYVKCFHKPFYNIRFANMLAGILTQLARIIIE